MDQIKKAAGLSLGRVKLLLRWMLLGGLPGMGIGVIAGLFGRSINIVTAFRNANRWMIFLMPLAGLLIVLLYRFDPKSTGTNRVLEGISKGEHVPLRMAPLIIFSTILTHAVGGSAGREGAALQLGGSIGGSVGHYLKLDEYDRKIMIMAGMSAAFSALFGTPLTAIVFAMEVISVGIMQYAALVPCAFAAMAAHKAAELVGAEGEHFVIPTNVEFDFRNATLIIVLGFLCAFVSIVFCKVLHSTEHVMKKYIPNPWIKVLVGSGVLIALTLLINSTDYLGAGMNIIEESMEGEAVPAAFLLKMIFTAITLSCGLKGGEIVPTLFVGATFGCTFGNLVGLSPSLCAACGMAAMFAGVTNCPISSLILSFELFGFENMPFFLFAIAVSYMESGYHGLYHSQKLLYSKTKLQFINRHTS